MTFGEKLRQSRQIKKLTQKQLADLIGAKHNSVSDWENDKNKPDPDTIELLCGILEISPNYLLSTSVETFSPKEIEHIKKYRSLDDHGKETVNIILERESERTQLLRIAYSTIEPLKKQFYTTAEDSTKKVSTRLINYYYRLASAGLGQILFDMPPTKRIEIPDLPEYRKADYAIGVNGNSMEPTYSDGDMLLVEMAEEIAIGEIGIFTVNNECFVKKLGNQELISLNPEYPNILLNETTKCMGRVIGKL